MEPLLANDPRAIGEFALRARLGSGGMGRVYLGFSPGGRAVAIKVVHPELARDPEFLLRFGREVASARAVSGVYTAPVVASGLSDDPPWMATAFVPGPPLADVVNSHGPLPEAAVWRLAAGLTEALHAVHACNLVHRDLKPSNVLLAPDGPRVIDFGISRAFEGTALTSAGMVVGTPGYMSPEQAEGQQAGPQSDVFSLGCVLAYAATGGAPFGAGSAASVLYRVVTAEPDLRLVPDRLRQVIVACLAKRAEDRARLAQLTAMISALGPPATLGLGSFWPEPVASIVAGEQGYHAPTQVSSGSAGPSRSGWTQSAPDAPMPAVQPGVPPASWPPGQPVPTAAASLGGALAGLVQPAAFPPDVIQTGMVEPGLAQPGAFQPGLAQPAGMPQPGTLQPGTLQPGLAQPAAMPQPGLVQSGGPAPAPAPRPGGTGHAPMVADGYYAAATMGAQPPAGQSWPPQYPPGQQPSWPQAGAPGTQYAAPQQQPATMWPQSGQQSAPWPPPQPGVPTPWPTAGGAGAPGPPNPLAQYTPGHRRPSAAEVPGAIRTAVRLIYLAAAVTLLNVFLGASVEARDNQYVQLHPLRLVADRQDHTTAGELALTAVAGGIIGIVCWIAVAMACRRGHSWSRVAATILLAVHTAGMLTVLFLTVGDPAVKATSVVIWVIGLAAVILLWTQRAYAFFQSTRGR